MDRSGGDSAIVAENLGKRYGDLRAVDGVSFTVRRGEIYGLLGPNGAGKTTTLSMLSGLLRPDQGRITLRGIDLAAEPLRVKALLGVVPQETAIYEELTATENLRFWGSMYGLSGTPLDDAVRETLDRLGLSGRAKEPVRRFSGGMKRRLNLGLGLVHRPQVVLLDEPTVGIDPQARLNILEVVGAVAATGATVLYTTHYLEEAETLCDRVGILDHGRLLAEGTLDELKRMVGEEDLVTLRGAFDPDGVRERIEREEGLRVLAAERGRVVVSAAGAGESSMRLLSSITAGDLPVDGISIQPPSLNSLFLKLTGRELRD